MHKSGINRRHFLGTSLTLGASALLPRAVLAAPRSFPLTATPAYTR